MNEPEDVLIRQPVFDEEAFLPRFHEPGSAQDLQVLGRIRDAHGSLFGQRLHGARPLAEKLQQLDALGRRNRLADPGELAVDAVFHLTRAHLSYSPIFK
jgi:hypothetical protein